MGVQAAKLSRATVATGLFLVLLCAVYVIHARFLSVNVVFYAALADVVVATGVCAVVLWTMRWFDVLGGFEKLQLLAIWLLTGYALAISVPTVIDRSLSIYILEKLDQRGGRIRQDAFAHIIGVEFMREHRVVDVRLTEQLESGTISIEGGCVTLTDKGRRIAGISRVFRNHLLPKQRLLMGEYSDDLTDPFRRSDEHSDYACAPR